MVDKSTNKKLDRSKKIIQKISAFCKVTIQSWMNPFYTQDTQAQVWTVSVS